MIVTNSENIDTQQVEIIGRNLLISCCIADGVEVAQPIRDRGIDLIIFDDLSKQKQFTSLPIQLKAASKMSFSVNKKYAKIPNMLMAYVWFNNDPVNARLYIMRYGDAISIARQTGWLDTKSWLDGGSYSTQSPSKSLIDNLQQYEYKPGAIRVLMSESS